MFIEKRAHLEEIEFVKLTKDNMQEVAEWCNGEVIKKKYLLIAMWSNPLHTRQVYTGMYVAKDSEGKFSAFGNSFFNDWYNRNEKGELIDG